MAVIVRVGKGTEHLKQCGVYAGPITGMCCLKHQRRRIGQPLTLADLKYEGHTLERSDLWCAECAKFTGRERGHVYVVQGADRGGYEVVDITFPTGSFVPFRARNYQTCYDWIDRSKRK